MQFAEANLQFSVLHKTSKDYMVIFIMPQKSRKYDNSLEKMQRMVYNKTSREDPGGNVFCRKEKGIETMKMLRTGIGIFAAAAVLIYSGCVSIDDRTADPGHKSAAESGTEGVEIVITGRGTTTESVEVIAPVVTDNEEADSEALPLPVRDTPVKFPDLTELHEKYEKIRTDNDVYGLGIAVFRDGDIIHTDALGLDDIDREIPGTDETHFRAASVSKLISTIGIMQLCDEGLLDVDGDISEATGIPYTNVYGDEVKLWHILTHTAGITDSDYFEMGISARYDIETVLEHSLTGHTPGTYYNYSNFGAGTMGAIIERKTDRFFHDYMRENVFDPLGINASYVIDDIEDKESCAVIYDHDGEVFNVPAWGRTAAYYESFGLGNSYLAAQCELLITAHDLAMTGTALAGDGTVKSAGDVRLLSEKAVEAMHKSYFHNKTFDMGLNVRIYDGTLVDGRVMYGHPGNALGAICGLYYDRSDHTGVAILTNHCNLYINNNGVYKMLDEVVKTTYEAFF